MKQDAEIVSKRVKSAMPGRFYNPSFIVDIGQRTRFTTQEFATIYPKAKIFSVQFDIPNFLVDQNALAYHDNVIFSQGENPFNIDEFAFVNFAGDEEIDYLSIDLDGYEKEFFTYYELWAKMTKAVKARLGDDYHYNTAKADLAKLGFKTWAMFNGISFYVIGERDETIGRNTTPLWT
jgi:hypothetical protein